jgi:hypothetical protein
MFVTPPRRPDSYAGMSQDVEVEYDGVDAEDDVVSVDADVEGGYSDADGEDAAGASFTLHAYHCGDDVLEVSCEWKPVFVGV